MRTAGKRHDRVSEHFRPAADRLAHAGFAAIAIADFHQAYTEIGPADGIVGPQRKRAPKRLDGIGVISVQHQKAAEFSQDVGSQWRQGGRPHQQGSRLCAIERFWGHKAQADLRVARYGHLKSVHR